MRRDYPKLLVSDKKGRIFDIPSLEATGMKGGYFFRLTKNDIIRLPYGSELFMLPDRIPVGFDNSAKRFASLGGVFAVSAFISPGYTITYNSSYIEIDKPKMLPLFSYAALAFYRGEFYVTAVRVDRECRQDLRYMNIDLARKNAERYKKLFPHNRLIRHLEKCAFIYACPAAMNFFLNRYECPLPASPYCNAGCVGCISHQPDDRCHVTQPRIKFFPSPEEIAEIALYHIENVRDPVVSFGQGCEGEPLLVSQNIERAIRLIRRKTRKGIINLNTNASRPQGIARLFDAGLNSLRVSLNSAREDYYLRYYRPRGYAFKDVVDSIKIAKTKNGFVSINYLIMPGFVDLQSEFYAFKRFLEKYKIDMVQWRNLNFDPLRYFKTLKLEIGASKLLGVRQIIRSVKESFPHIITGYFNPSKDRIRRMSSILKI